MGFWHLAALLTIAAVVAGTLYAYFADDWLALDLRRALRRPATYLVGLPAFLVVMLVGVPYVYLQSTSVDSPPPLSFEDLPGFSTSTTAGGSSTTVAPGTEVAAPIANVVLPDTGTAPPTTAAATTVPTTLAPAPLDGHWAVSRGSQARYAIDDTVLGQTQRVVGTTDQVTGEMEIAGSTVTAARVVVDMRSVHCDCVHDSKYQDMLDTDRFPTSTFELTSPIALSTIPPDGQVVRIPVTGKLTVHGVTRTITTTVDAVQRNGRIGINGTIPVRLPDHDIENPDAGAFGGLSNAAIELLIGFVRG